MSDACEMADFVEPPPMNNNKEAEEKQTSKSKKKKKASAQDSTNSEDVVEITKRKEVPGIRGQEIIAASFSYHQL